MKKSRSGRSDVDVIRLARLYGCGVPGLKKVAKAAKRHGHNNSFHYNTEDSEKVNAKLKGSEFFISNGVKDFEGFENYYIPILELKDMFEKSFRVKFTSNEVAAFVQEMKCTELDSFRETKIIFNKVLKQLKMLGNTLRSLNYSKVREDNETHLEFRLKYIQDHDDEEVQVMLDPTTIFNTLWEIHDACREHWELKSKKFMELLHNNFNTPTGVVDGEKLREFLRYNIDAKVTSEHCKMLIIYLNGMESRLSTTVAVHFIVMALKLLAQDRHCPLTPPPEEEEEYNIFCETVKNIQSVLTDQSRASRIANRSIQIARREEKLKNKKKLTSDPSSRSSLHSLSAPISTSTGSKPSSLTSKNIQNISKPIEQSSSSHDIKNNRTALEPMKHHERKAILKTKEPPQHAATVHIHPQKKMSNTQGLSSKTTSSLSNHNRKQLAPFVAHSTDVSSPGGGSAILRAKTPLLLDRPVNIRDHVGVSPAPISRSHPALGSTDGGELLAEDEVSVTSTTTNGTKNTLKNKAKRRDKKEPRLELCPVQLDTKGNGLRYDLRYRTLATFITVLETTRKVSIDDIIQAFWAKKQDEIGVGLDIMSENGVTVDRNGFVDVLGSILPRFLEANTLFSVLDPSRSGYLAIHQLHLLVSLYHLQLTCDTSGIVEAALRAATWEVLNCRMHQDSKVKSSLSTASKANNATQIAVKKLLEENSSNLQEKERKVKLEVASNNSRLKGRHIRLRVAAEAVALAEAEEDGGKDSDVKEETLQTSSLSESDAMRGAYLPPGILNACIRAICSSPETEKHTSLTLFSLIKRAQAENIWDENFLQNHRGYTRDDVSVGYIMDSLSKSEDFGVLLKEELMKMHAKINAHALMGTRQR